MSELFWVEDHRDMVMVEGPDALTYLQSQVSQDLRPLVVGASTYTFILQPTGKVEVLARVLRSGEHAYILDVDHGCGDVMLARLQRFKIRVAAELTRIPWRCLAVRGPGADRLAPLAGSVTLPAWWGDGTAVDMVGPAPQPPPGVAHATPDDLEAARIEAGWPRHGSEIIDSTLPSELGVVPVAVSFTKGCYPGQELVERMDSRGARAPRLLHRVTVAPGSAVGDPVVVDGMEVGRLTSIAGTRGLALIRRDVEFGEVVAPPA